MSILCNPPYLIALTKEPADAPRGIEQAPRRGDTRAGRNHRMHGDRMLIAIVGLDKSRGRLSPLHVTGQVEAISAVRMRVKFRLLGGDGNSGIAFRALREAGSPTGG